MHDDAVTAPFRFRNSSLRKRQRDVASERPELCYRGGRDMVFRFELENLEGEDAGMFVTSLQQWRVGDKFLSDANRSFQIAAIVPPEPEGTRAERSVSGRWRVEPI